MGQKKGKVKIKILGTGRAVKRARQKFGSHYESEEVKLAPHSMVIPRGPVDKSVKELIQDVRRVMLPFTAAELRATKKNSLKDFVSIAGPLHVSHLLIFSQTELGENMKIIRMPRGPSLHFKLVDFSLTNDVLNAQKKRHTHQKQFLHQPLLILNGFSAGIKQPAAENKDEPKPEFHLKLLAATLQNMFPTINITKIKLNEIRRCVLFNYNKEDKSIDFRQYYIRLSAVGLSKPVKKLVQEKIPDLSNFQDISEYFEKGGNLSESEAELDDPESQVKVNQDDLSSRHAVNLKSSTSAIRLYEIGPRMKLKLVKIEEGVCDGEVLYHDLIRKTPEELAALRESLKAKKKAEKEQKSAAADRARKYEKDKNSKSIEKNRNKNNGGSNRSDDEAQLDNDIDDAEHFRNEVGQEPDSSFLSRKPNFKRHRGHFDDDYLKDVDLEDSTEKPSKAKRSNGKVADDENDDREYKRAKKSNSLVRFAGRGGGGRKNGDGKEQTQQRKAKFLGFSKKKKELWKQKNRS